jgi:hypothetical protein
LENMVRAAAWTLEPEGSGGKVGRWNAIARQDVGDDVDVRIGTPVNKRGEAFIRHGCATNDATTTSKRSTAGGSSRDGNERSLRTKAALKSLVVV